MEVANRKIRANSHSICNNFVVTLGSYFCQKFYENIIPMKKMTYFSANTLCECHIEAIEAVKYLYVCQTIS